MPTVLFSVYEKAGVAQFAESLVRLGWNILASGGTARSLRVAGIETRDVSEFTGGGAILDHRVVTLSREIHAALLARDTPEDTLVLTELGVPRIDLVCVDLYPLQSEIGRAGRSLETVIEQTDIGGPAILRSAAKGRRIVICDAFDRQRVLDWLYAGRPDAVAFIGKMCAKAEFTVAQYCLASARFLGEGMFEGILGSRVLLCKYGENAVQTPAALHSLGSEDPLAIDKFELAAGDALSFNNLRDVDRVLQTVTHIAAGFDVNRNEVPLIAVAVKHGNACGAAVGDNPVDVLERMISGDSDAILGGVAMANFPIGDKEAETILSYGMPAGSRRNLDLIAAPAFTSQAIAMLRRKKDKCRFLSNPALLSLRLASLDRSQLFRPLRGGFLVQPNYTYVMDFSDSRLLKSEQLSHEAENDLLLAWAIGATSNSNTITLVRNGSLVANGVAQQSRVGGCRVAILRAESAGHSTAGCYAYSDSFFPLSDGPEPLHKAGVKGILTSSGSVNDKDTIAFCEKGSLPLYMIPDAVGRGFHGH